MKRTKFNIDKNTSNAYTKWLELGSPAMPTFAQREKIMESGEDKCLIFVSSKERGEILQETLGDDAVFISADSKGNDAWNIRMWI